MLAEIEELGVAQDETKIARIVEKRLREEIRRGVQTIQYQVVTLLTTNGQAPFITVFMYLNEARSEQEKRDLALIIEEMLLQRYEGVKNEQGVWVTPAFPKLIYTLEEDNIHEDSPYYYLTKLAAKCTARRMVPDYISEKKMLELKGDVYPCMGCRSFLTPDRFTDAGVGNIANAGNYEPGKHKYYGRFNQGVVTINLPDVALSSGGNIEKFWDIFEDRLELCHRALALPPRPPAAARSPTPRPSSGSTVPAPASRRASPSTRLLYDGYSTISLGYAGLYECVKYMTGKSHTDPAATPFALSIMQKMNDKCKEWKSCREHRLFPLRHAAGVHDLQVCQVPAKALRHHRGRDRQGLYHQQLPCPCHRADRRLHQAQVRGAVPAPLARRRDQLRRGPQYAEQP